MIIELVLVVVAFNWPRFKFSGAVAQLGERLICIQEVAGSIPTSSTSVVEPDRRHSPLDGSSNPRACSSAG